MFTMKRIYLQVSRFVFTLSCSRNSQQYQRMCLICLIHRRVRSLERARDTYHTYEQDKEDCNRQIQGPNYLYSSYWDGTSSLGPALEWAVGMHR